MADEYEALGLQPASATEAAADPNDPYALLGLERADAPGKMESFLRGAAEGATFGFDDKLGLSKEAREASRASNPWTHFAGEMVGGLAPMVAAAPAAGAIKGAGLAARAGRGALGLLAPAEEINTVGQAIRTGAKVGATYGGLSGAGHADVQDDDSAGLALVKRGLGAGQGALAGLILGPAVGAGGYGASKVAGALLNKMAPEAGNALAYAKTPELMGLNDLIKYGGYDGVTMADLTALQAAMRAEPQRFQGLNLIEALQTVKPLQEVRDAAGVATGELKPDIRALPNLTRHAQDMANVEGAGATAARQAFESRRSEMPTVLSRDIDTAFSPATPEAVALRTSATQPGGFADDMARLPTVINAASGAGDSEAAKAANDAIKTALSKRYSNMVDKAPDLMSVRDLGLDQASNPVLKDALDFAWQRNSTAITHGRPGMDAPGKLYNPASGTIGNEIATLSPEMIFDMHYYLGKVARASALGGDTKETMMAQEAKRQFSEIVDAAFKNHKQLRTEYAMYKAAQEAETVGQKLGTFGAKRGGEEMAAVEKMHADLRKAEAAALEARRTFEANVDRHNRFLAGEAPSKGGALKNPPAPTAVNATTRDYHAKQGVVNALRREWGENLNAEIAKVGDDVGKLASTLKQWTSPASEQRMRQILGDREGNAMVQELRIMRARHEGRALGLKAGGDESAPLNFLREAQRNGNTEVLDAFRLGWGQAIKNSLSQQGDSSAARVARDLTTPAGQARVREILGPEQARAFMDALYNKIQQAGLSQKLYGGPDTAYKLNRVAGKDALTDIATGIATLRLGKVWSGVHDLASQAYKMKRADQVNELMSRQGIDKVGEVVDSMVRSLGEKQRGQKVQVLPKTMTGGEPLEVRPGLTMLGPFTGTVPGQASPFLGQPERRRKP